MPQDTSVGGHGTSVRQVLTKEPTVGRVLDGKYKTPVNFCLRCFYSDF